jgi:hypothetical protein
MVLDFPQSVPQLPVVQGQTRSQRSAHLPLANKRPLLSAPLQDYSLPALNPLSPFNH